MAKLFGNETKAYINVKNLGIGRPTRWCPVGVNLRFVLQRWQKGTNEKLNGLLREFYPKGRNLSRVSPTTLKKNLALINARPKKVLGFKKPVDLFEFSLKKCCT